MTLTRDEHSRLTDLILQCRARTMEYDDARRKMELANKALGEFIGSLVGPSVPDEERQSARYYPCLRCQGPAVTLSSYCAKCAGANAKQSQEPTGDKQAGHFAFCGNYNCRLCASLGRVPFVKP